jgi:SnoaL-like domain
MDDLATRLQTALNARDLDALSSLLATDARWGEDPQGDGFCHDRHDILGRFQQLIDEGVQARINETTTGPRGIAVRLHVDWPDPEDRQRPELQTVYMAYLVVDGLISEIHGQDDEDSALAAISS